MSRIFFFKKMEQEQLAITSRKEPSVLRQTHHNVLPSLKMAAFVEDLKTKVPFTNERLYTSYVSKAKKHELGNGEQVNNVIATIAAIMLQN